MFLSILILSFVFGTIWPFFDSCSMLFVFEPLTHISRSIGMFIGSMSMCFIIQPLALIYVSISMDQSSLTVSLVSLPLSIIFRSVLPDLLAIAVFKAIEKFTSVYGTVGQSNWTVSLTIVVVYHFVGNSIIIWTSSLIIVFNVIILWHHTWMNIIHHLSIVLSLSHFLLLLRVIILVISWKPFLTLDLVIILILIIVLIKRLLLPIWQIHCLSSELVLLVQLLSLGHLVLRDYVLIFVFVSRLTGHTQACTVSHFLVFFSVLKIN